MNSNKSDKIVFVLDIRSGGKDSALLRANLAELTQNLPIHGTTPKPASEEVEPTGILLGSGRSFRDMIVELEKQGLSISNAYQRPDGKVIFVTGNTLDSDAELLFLKLVACTGWSVVRYDNPDGTIVFAAKAPCFLSEMVKGRDDTGEKTLVARDWEKYLIIL